MKRLSVACFTTLLFSHLPMVNAQDIRLIVPLGHTRKISEVKVSPNSRWLASADGSDELKIWDFSTGKEVYHFQMGAPVSAMDYHPSRQELAGADASGKVILWNEKGEVRWQAEASDQEILQVLFSPGGDTLVTVTATQIMLWKSADGTRIGNIQPELSSITTACMDAFSHFLVTGDLKGNLSIIKLSDGRSFPLQMVSEGTIEALFPTRDHLLIGTNRGELIALTKSGFELTTIQAFSYRTFAVAAAAERIVACGRDESTNIRSFQMAGLAPAGTGPQLQEDPGSEEFALGLRIVARGTDSTLLIADYRQVIREYDVKNQRWMRRQFSGAAAAVYDLAVNAQETRLAIASGHSHVSVLDLTGTGSDLLLPASERGSRAVDFHPVNPVLAAYGLNDRITVSNLVTRESIFELKAKGTYSSTPITFDPTGRYILRKSSDKDFDFYNFKSNVPKNLKVKNGLDYLFSPDGRKLIFQTPDGLSIYDPITFAALKEVSCPDIQDIAMSPDGRLLALLKDDVTIVVFDEQFTRLSELKLSPQAASDELIVTPDSKMVVGFKNSVKRGETIDFSLKLIDLPTGKLLKSLPGHAGFTSSIVFVNGRMLTAGVDGMIRVWDFTAREKALQGMLIPLDSGNYVVTTPSGLYDATPHAMKSLHYIKSGQLIGLDQMKDHYYEPLLLSKILGLNDEPIQSTASFSDLSLYPELTLDHPLKNGGKLGINLTSNGGGIGRVVILINGKEVSSDVRAAAPEKSNAHLEIDYDISDHPYLYTDRVNKITIKAYNIDGTLSSDEKSLYVFGEEKTLEAPHLYAVIAGTSDYRGDQLDLKYAAKDAADLAGALELSAVEYLGADHTHITLLTTDQGKDLWPTKTNIRDAFEDFKTRAKANDILLVYLSGHGVNHGGEASDFYYLTCEAENGDLNHSVQRETAAISSAEFTEYIKAVPALKQILIVDACHSGRMASSLASSRSAMSTTQIRALERMKDRTGLFVLAGSAADAVSYETTLFGQGLLTYSLLFGMKGAALRDGEFLDVMDWFQFAANKVPELAEEIGGIQKPEIRLPEEGKSFDIGRLSAADQEQIVIKSPKPVYVFSRFQDESSIYDRLNVGNVLDRKLIELSKTKDAPLVFVDEKDFSSAITIHGRYREANGLILAKVTFLKQGEVLTNVELEAVNADQLTGQVLQIVRSVED